MDQDAQQYQRARERTDRALWAIAKNAKGSVLNRGLLISLVLIVLDTLLVSHYQPQTALALMRYTPPVALFTGVLTNLLPIILPALFWLTAGLGVFAAARGEERGAFSYLSGSVVIFLIGALFIDSRVLPGGWVLAITLFAAFSVYGIARWLERRDSSTEILFAMIFFVLIVFIGGQLWESQELRTRLATPFLPSERISFANGGSASPEITGYVLDVDQSGHWTTLLLEAERTVVIVPTSSITARSVCSLTATSFSPQWAVTPVGAGDPGCHQ